MRYGQGKRELVAIKRKIKMTSRGSVQRDCPLWWVVWPIGCSWHRSLPFSSRNLLLLRRHRRNLLLRRPVEHLDTRPCTRPLGYYPTVWWMRIQSILRSKTLGDKKNKGGKLTAFINIAPPNKPAPAPNAAPPIPIPPPPPILPPPKRDCCWAYIGCCIIIPWGWPYIIGCWGWPYIIWGGGGPCCW